METEQEKGIVFIFISLEMLGKRRAQGNLFKQTNKQKIYFFLMMLPAARVTERGKGQPPCIVGGNAVQHNLSAKLLARLYQYP